MDAALLFGDAAIPPMMRDRNDQQSGEWLIISHRSEQCVTFQVCSLAPVFNAADLYVFSTLFGEFRGFS